MEFGRDAAVKLLEEKKILRVGEKVLWADTPNEDAYHYETKFDAALLFIILMFAVGLPILLIGWPWCLIAEVFPLILFSFFAYLVFYDRNHKNRKEANAVTNVRVLHYFQSCWGWKQEIDDLYLDQVIDIDMSKDGYGAKKYNVGTIYFRARGGSSSSVTFKQISDPTKMYEEFKDFIIKKLDWGVVDQEGRKTKIKGKASVAKPKGMDETNAELREIKEVLKRIEKKL